jgi:hypothetical protein
MACKFIEIGSGQNLFIGGYKNLKQWSVSQGEVTKDYGQIMAGDIPPMVQTSDKKYLFVSDISGYLKQIDVKKQKVVRDYGNIHDDIVSITITSDDKYLFTCGGYWGGRVQQFSVRSGKMIKV